MINEMHTDFDDPLLSCAGIENYSPSHLLTITTYGPVVLLFEGRPGLGINYFLRLHSEQFLSGIAKLFFSSFIRIDKNHRFDVVGENGIQSCFQKSHSHLYTITNVAN